MLLVKSYCAYLTRTHSKWRDEDYATRLATKLVKGDREGVNSRYCLVPKLDGKGGFIKFLNCDESIDGMREHFAEWAARELKPLGKVTLFPVPNSIATPGMSGSYGTLDIADMIADASGSRIDVNDKLRFKKVMPKSSKGGSRDRLLLAREMLMPSGSKLNGVPVLFDDVLTTGAHLLASRTVLASRGIDVENAIVCGRSFEDQLPDPFKVDDEDIDDAAFFGALG